MRNIAWDAVCKPKKLGGLGFREGCLWNKMSMGKYLWAISFKMDSLWLKWVHSIYLKHTDFWTVGVKNGCSWCWRKLLNLRSCLSSSIISNSMVVGKFSMAKCYGLLLGSTAELSGYKQIWCTVAPPGTDLFSGWRPNKSSLPWINLRVLFQI